MGDDRVIEQIGRIDRALARIEAAAARAPAPASLPEDGRAAALEDAHRTLRARVESAISQLDQLIAAGDGG